MMTMPQLIGSNIKRLRLEAGWSQAEFATRVQEWGINWRQGQISRVEGGHVPGVSRVETLLILCGLFDRPMSWFFKSDPTYQEYDTAEVIPLTKHARVSPVSIRVLVRGQGRGKIGLYR